MSQACMFLLLAVLQGPASPAPASAAEPADRFQPAIRLGDLEALDGARLEIQRTLAVGGVEEQAVTEWRYDWAYLNWRIGQLLRDVDDKRRKSLLKEAQEQLDLVLETDAQNAEAHALRGSVIGDRIGGGLSGAILGPRASSSLKAAMELEPDNPRVMLLSGIGSFFTPKTFGGGEEAALEELRRAVELFEAQPEDQPWPNWGRVDALGWMGVVLAKRGETEQARVLYEEAVSLEPRNAWIRELLVAAAEE